MSPKIQINYLIKFAGIILLTFFSSSKLLARAQDDGYSIFLPLTITSAKYQDFEWRLQQVDTQNPAGEMSDRSLRVDAAGNPHIAYGLSKLMYARYNGQIWSW
jgi:hypothetical protein